MDSRLIDGVLLTPLARISTPGGDVYHGMKHTDVGFAGFGEAYLSAISSGAVKAWKRHRRMTLNLVVPVGEIFLVLYDDREASPSYGRFQKITLSINNYSRLTVPPMVWMGFKGTGQNVNMLLNVANIPHDPNEVDRLEKEHFNFDWG